MNHLGGRRPLSTRSVLLSGLMAFDPPRLPVARLVRLGTLFGSTEGAVRTALSRAVATGDVVTDDGWYELSPRLRERQDRQGRSRRLERRPWDGTWRLFVVRDVRRERSERDALRRTLLAHRHAELREGVWTRPDDLVDADPVEAVEQCDLFRGVGPADPRALADRLWDHPGWAADADRLRREIEPLAERLREGDESVLAPGFRLAAAVLRHLLDDPALPHELVADPDAGDRLRCDYDAFDAAYGAVLLRWLQDADRAPLNAS